MNNLQVIEHQNKRVLTTAQLAEGYGTDTQTITNNFNRNKERYQAGKHYFLLEGEFLRDFRAKTQIDLPPNINKLYLWTEYGALLHAKSLGTDQAWTTYDMLVYSYFRAREQATTKPAITQAELLAGLAQELVNAERTSNAALRLAEAASSRVDELASAVNANITATVLRNRFSEACEARGLNKPKVLARLYAQLEAAEKCDLSARLARKQQRMKKAGAARREWAAVRKIDVVADSSNLAQRFLSLLEKF